MPRGQNVEYSDAKESFCTCWSRKFELLCRLCKSVGDNISHSKNLFAKNNRALLASVEELYGGSLSQNELLHVATFGM